MALIDAFKHFPVLETERLLLRQLRSEDAVTFGRLYGTKNPLEYITKSNHRYKNKKNKIEWAITLKSDNVILGTCFLASFVKESMAEMGYWIKKDFRKQGMMTEAVTAICSYALDEERLHKIFAMIATHNRGSIKVAERVGFHKDALLKNWQGAGTDIEDAYMYSILRSDVANSIEKRSEHGIKST